MISEKLKFLHAFLILILAFHTCQYILRPKKYKVQAIGILASGTTISCHPQVNHHGPCEKFGHELKLNETTASRPLLYQALQKIALWPA